MSDRDGTNHLLHLRLRHRQGDAADERPPDATIMPRFSPDGKWIAFERDSKRAARHRSGDEGREAARDRHLRHAAVRRLRATSRGRPTRASSPTSPPAPRRSRTCTSCRRAGGEARAGQLSREHERRIAVVEPRRHLPDVHDVAAHRAGRRDPGRSDAAHAEVPRGSVPRSVQRGAAEDAERRRRPRPRPTCPGRPTRRGCRDVGRAGPSRSRSSSTTSAAARASLPVGVDVARQEISPDGKWLLLTASAAGQQNLYVFPIDELSKEPAVARQLTSTPGAKRSAHFTPTARRSTTWIAAACST